MGAENRLSDNGKFAVRALFFDLDGTLIDSKLDLALSVNAALGHMNRAPLPHAVIFGLVGQGAPTLIRRALVASAGAGAAEPDDAQVDQGLRYFLAYYREHMLDNTLLYPGVREGLEGLAAQGQAMAVLTNKPERFSKLILQGLGVAGYFRFVYGGNTFEKKKPDPMGVQVLLRDFAVPPAQAMMVGDSEIDVLTARNSSIWCCGVTYGLGSHLLGAYPPDLLLDSLADLPAHVHRAS
jgi:phosphoglycolate phosphatase